MKKIDLILILVLGWLLVFACSNDNPDEIPDVPVNVDPYDTASIAWVLDNIMNYTPTWEQLEKYTDTATFLPIPNFTKRIGNYAEEEGNPYGDDYLGGLQEDLNGLLDFFGANESAVDFNDMPPFYQVGETFVVPYPLDRLDEKLRATTVLYLFDKSRGLPTKMINFYPPFAEWGNFTTRSDFDSWFESEYLPEKIAEAQAAELMKAERFTPWPLELEVFINQVGGIGNGGFLDGVSNQDILDFANEVKERIFNTVRPLYSGRLVAHLHNNYFNRPEAHFWDQMSYAEFDEISFAFFPPYDPETTANYMDEQLEHYMKVLENSGNLPWIAGEVSVFEWYVQDGMITAFEKDMYQVALEKIENAPFPHSGVEMPAGYMRTEAARNYLKEYLSTR